MGEAQANTDRSRYEYRFLRMTLYGFNVLAGRTRRVDGSTSEHYLGIEDSALSDTHRFLDERGEKLANFVGRAHRQALGHLNDLGSEGWRVISREGGSVYLPDGAYLLMREL